MYVTLRLYYISLIYITQLLPKIVACNLNFCIMYFSHYNFTSIACEKVLPDFQFDSTKTHTFSRGSLGFFLYSNTGPSRDDKYC